MPCGISPTVRHWQNTDRIRCRQYTGFALLAQIDEALESETPEPALEALAGTVPAISVSVQRQDAEHPVFEITALIPVSDSQNLQLTVNADAASHTRRITAWRETAVSGWEEQTTLPVLGSDRTEND